MGKNQFLLLLRDWHLGKKFGDFIVTRAMGKAIHMEKTKKKGKKNKGK
jgi:ribosomal protein S19